MTEGKLHLMLSCHLDGAVVSRGCQTLKPLAMLSCLSAPGRANFTGLLDAIRANASSKMYLCAMRCWQRRGSQRFDETHA